MAFVYEKIPEEEKENLKIKLKDAEKWLENAINFMDKKFKEDNTYNFYPDFFFLDHYKFPDMWAKDYDNDILLVQYGFTNCSGEPFADFHNSYSVYFIFVKENIVIFEANEISNYIEIESILVSEKIDMNYNNIIKVIEKALKISFQEKIVNEFPKEMDAKYIVI